jgi:hypothetical protein
MKGILLDENLPTRLRFQPSLPVVPLTMPGGSPSDTELGAFARRDERS